MVKKNDNQNFKTLISFSCQTLFFIYSQHFIKKIVFSRFGHGLEVRETGAWRGWATQFFNWLSKFSALFFSDGSKRYQTWFEWYSNSNCLFQKKHKNCPAAFGSTSRPRLWCAWVKPLYLARRPSATFLGITWSLGLSSPKRLNRILVAHLQWTLEIVYSFFSRNQKYDSRIQIRYEVSIHLKYCSKTVKNQVKLLACELPWNLKLVRL